ncbi:uracil-DNA glycosylase [Polycladidibacter hongkongensis]|uniref:uracil-DNA glycosylase n=1 Tax=Polycladidibacter hongkongensis TaxID=1647556 RepID=UPI000835E668|nr:uracil-DNA glycosylase [Pseudovibrio hongkongensis]
MRETVAVDPSYLPALEAYFEFLEASGVDCLLDEEPVYRFTAQQVAAATPQPVRALADLPEATGQSQAQPQGKLSKPLIPPDFCEVTAASKEKTRSLLASQKATHEAQGLQPASANAAVLPDAQAINAAREAAAKAQSLDELRRLLQAFDGCNLKRTAKQLVFGDGSSKAPVMMIGEAPGKEEDHHGVPFVGPSGRLLDTMLEAAGLDRSVCYIANVVPWRPPGNRTPTPQETEICRPFIQRQIELLNPQIVVFLGAASAAALTGSREGIRRMRGKWMSYGTGAEARPALATYHPAYLLRTPAEKRLAWRDILSIKAKLYDLGWRPPE